MSELGDLIRELIFSLKSRFSPVSDSQVLMTPAEVAALFRVDPKTVTRWADAGKLTAVRTLGGHRRYRQDEVQNLLVASSISLPAANEGASV
jgi:excisionase family DNA binding protein